LDEVSKTLESKQDLSKDISCLHTRTSEALAHTCKYDKNLDSKNYALNPAAHPNSAQNLESTPTEHANKTTNSSSCSVALEALADLEGRSYLSDMTIHHNSAKRSNCIDKGANLENLESTQNTLQNPIPNQATQNLNSLLAKDSLLFKPIDTLTQELFNTNSCPYLPKLYGIYKSVDEIDFSKLPQSFVLKTNHDCGGVVLVKDKDTFLKDSKSFNEAMTKLTTHLNTNFYTLYREWHYKDIEPRIFAEEMLGDTQKHSLIDYKIHTMQNIISHIEVITDRHTGQKEIAMDTKWHKVPFDYEKKSLQIPQKPIMLDKMLDMSLLLAQAFQYVRVDLYCVEMNIYVGELTFTPAGGTDKFTPQEWDKKLGDLWKYTRI
ncbi:MAG: ATP-grasp fold amidoligase family protein, partial [Helicobacter sp.]|uniref:ATP-grasp fold amidoligase family protein n=1 Tax=Helicobacter sp. TaxID=218 RepID=UPI002A90A3D8